MNGHRAGSEGLACGYHAVRTALQRTPARVERVLLARGQTDDRTRRIAALCRTHHVPFGQVPREALDRLARGVRHQGIVARLSGIDLIPLEGLLERLPRPALLVALDGVVDPRNLGAIARGAAGLGAGGLLLPARGSAGFTPAAMKTAAGAASILPVARVTNLGRALDRLAEEGLRAVALDPSGGEPPWRIDLQGPVVLVAGGEERGVRPSVRSRCERAVTIPVRPEIGSLNVAGAVTAVLLEAVRQRGGITV